MQSFRVATTGTDCDIYSCENMMYKLTVSAVETLKMVLLASRKRSSHSFVATQQHLDWEGAILKYSIVALVVLLSNRI